MIATDKQKMNLVSVPVILLISKISNYTVALQEEALYLSPGIGYHALSKWFAQYSKTSTDNEHKSSQISNVAVKNKESKIPAFKVPIFRGDTLDGDKYIKMIKTTFRSNVMS